MLTYWLVGEDPARRMARLQDVLHSSISSERKFQSIRLEQDEITQVRYQLVATIY